MPRLSADLWAAARLKWEADPALTFAALGHALGVSDEAVRKRAKAEAWERVRSLKQIAERAQLKADAKVGGKVGGPTTKSSDLAEDIRADVIDRHRSDWAEHRVHFKIAAIAADFSAGKSAKISAEMLLIRQKGERDAYGLSETAPSQQTPPEPDWAALIGSQTGSQADAADAADALEEQA